MANEHNLDGLIRDIQKDKPTRCSKCGAFLSYKGLGEYVCGHCGFVEYDSYGKVRMYLELNPGSNIVQTEAATGVPQKLIQQMISEGKFEMGSRHI